MIYSTIPVNNGNLRKHQLDAKNAILRAWDTFDSVMLQMPTGTGKTYLFTSIIKDLIAFYKSQKREINILVVAHRLELLDQIAASLKNYGIPCGFIQGTREQHLWQRVQVGSILSLISERNELGVRRCKFDFIIVDEAHHTLADSYKRLFDMFPEAKKLGVTATPWRMNHESFLSVYQTLITTPQVKWFIKNHLLSDFDYVSVKPDSNIQKLVNSIDISATGDFVNDALSEAFDNQRIRSKLYDSFHKYASDRKGIVYAINKQHARNIAELYTSKGFLSVNIDCDTPKDDRDRLIKEFKAGNIQVLVNVELFTEGFDCPDVSFIQLARPTRSLALYLQQVGRGLRITEGKEKTIFIDNVGLYNYFGLPDANRKWQHHFQGRDVPEEMKYESRGNLAMDIPERSYDEDDEAMMVVRGSGSLDESVEANEVLQDEAFNLCDYYQVNGNERNFSVYTLVKKKGKPTGEVGNVAYQYNENDGKFAFSSDVSKNIALLKVNTKLKSVLLFSASMCGISQEELFKLDGVNPEDGLSAFNLLKIIAKVYEIRNAEQTQCPTP
ncbi:MAG: DEAD/DEAH box helicase [Bacteroidales bacterium]|nr:DEAD/DEAH box helicase [Candidatus Cacconaster scatequi]